MAKRFFQILDDLNRMDEMNGTRNVSIANSLVEIKKVKQGGLVTIGVDYTSLNDMLETTLGNGKHIAVLLIIDKKKYDQQRG